MKPETIEAAEIAARKSGFYGWLFGGRRAPEAPRGGVAVPSHLSWIADDKVVARHLADGGVIESIDYETGRPARVRLRFQAMTRETLVSAPNATWRGVDTGVPIDTRDHARLRRARRRIDRELDEPADVAYPSTPHLFNGATMQPADCKAPFCDGPDCVQACKAPKPEPTLPEMLASHEKLVAADRAACKAAEEAFQARRRSAEAIDQKLQGGRVAFVRDGRLCVVARCHTDGPERFAVEPVTLA